MSIYAAIDEGEPDFLSSNQGWSAFGNWVDEIDVEQYGEVVALWEQAIADDPQTTAEQLQSALADSPPDDSNVAKTANDLLKHAHNQLLITNGATPEQ